jgi:hypothetical protein
LTDKKILSGVLSTAFCLAMILVPSTSAFAKNNLSSETNETAAAAAHKAALLLISTSKDKVLEKYENATSLTDSQLVELLKAVGFKGKGLKTAWAVAKAESNGRPFAFNGNTKTGDSSFGIFQINMLGTLGPDRRDKFELDLNAELFSPVRNAEIVYHMTKGGTNWSSWSSYNKGAHYKWLKKFPNDMI